MRQWSAWHGSPAMGGQSKVKNTNLALSALLGIVDRLEAVGEHADLDHRYRRCAETATARGGAKVDRRESERLSRRDRVFAKSFSVSKRTECLGRFMNTENVRALRSCQPKEHGCQLCR